MDSNLCDVVLGILVPFLTSSRVLEILNFYIAQLRQHIKPKEGEGEEEEDFTEQITQILNPKLTLNDNISKNNTHKTNINDLKESTFGKATIAYLSALKVLLYLNHFPHFKYLDDIES